MIVLLIDSDGSVEFLHDDSLIPLRDSLGSFTVSRASYVNFDNDRGGFAVFIPGHGDMGRVFSRRSDAIEAEKVFLSEVMQNGVSIDDLTKGRCPDW